ncbi:MAG: hypothetical protein EA344_07270 [Alkalicoccus sp.]|nr:MAG: hypothetical protein EA344_07270 [Alkalicoccus sp.]
MVDRIVLGCFSGLLLFYLFFSAADYSREPYFAAVLFIFAFSFIGFFVFYPVITSFWFFTGAGINAVLIVLLPLEYGRYLPAILLLMLTAAAAAAFMLLHPSQKKDRR